MHAYGLYACARFEAAGIATVAIGSIREQIYGTKPPRGLFCDFPLGRPLGVPSDAAFQRRVMEGAFSLLERDAPVVEDYDVVIDDAAPEVLVCPLPARMDPDAHPAIDEARGLRPAYDRAVRKYGNRAGAARLLDAEAIPAAIESFVRVAEGTPWKEAGIPGIPARVSQDIRGYYEMAAMEIAGTHARGMGRLPLVPGPDAHRRGDPGRPRCDSRLRRQGAAVALPHAE